MEYIIPLAVLILIFGPKFLREIKDYMLKREQIKSDASVRAEALRLKNEIELEKLIQNSSLNAESRQAAGPEDAQSTDRKTGDRLRY